MSSPLRLFDSPPLTLTYPNRPSYKFLPLKFFDTGDLPVQSLTPWIPSVSCLYIWSRAANTAKSSSTAL